MRVIGGALVLALAGLSGCDDINTVSRPAQPAVLTGGDLPQLVGRAPGRIVAFRHSRPDGRPSWTQIPVQVDERVVVPFGVQPDTNTSVGVTGTVYGNGSGGPTALQYADAGTFVGADRDPTFDADDELVFMISDAGGRPRAGEQTEPAGVVAGSGVAVRIDDPQADDHTGWAYLFQSAGTLTPAAGKDYVDYDFNLTSGPYRTTYRRRTGPNPETSQVTTPSYRIGYSDRWFEHSWRVDAGGSSGVDILDGHKNQFVANNCRPSNATFITSEGAFVANIDGPVRGIRSYVGANSGANTQRTHLMYRDQEVVVTDLRVHSITALMDFLDYSSAATGMTYRSSTATSGVTIDGHADAVGTGRARWEAVTGPQGTVITTSRMTTTIPGLTTSWFYRDQLAPPEEQCWGDASFFGASGPAMTGDIVNTDPATPPFADLVLRRTNHFRAPVDDGAALTSLAGALADDHDVPVRHEVTPYRP